MLDDVSICGGERRKKSRSLSRARVADASTGNSKFPDRRIESATAQFLIFKAHFYILFIVLVFVVFSLVCAKRSFASVFMNVVGKFCAI